MLSCAVATDCFPSAHHRLTLAAIPLSYSGYLPVRAGAFHRFIHDLSLGVSVNELVERVEAQRAGNLQRAGNIAIEDEEILIGTIRDHSRRASIDYGRFWVRFGLPDGLRPQLTVSFQAVTQEAKSGNNVL